MAEPRHSKQTLANGIHGIVAYEYDDAADRIAASGFEASDLYKLARDLDTGYVFLLADISPITWSEIGSGGGGGGGSFEFTEQSGTIAPVTDAVVVAARTQDSALITRRATNLYEASVAGRIITSSTSATEIARLYMETDTYAMVGVSLSGVNRGTPTQSMMYTQKLLIRCNGSNAITVEELSGIDAQPSVAPAWVGTDYSLVFSVSTGTANNAIFNITAGNTTSVVWTAQVSALVTEDAAS